MKRIHTNVFINARDAALPDSYTHSFGAADEAFAKLILLDSVCSL